MWFSTVFLQVPQDIAGFPLTPSKFIIYIAPIKVHHGFCILIHSSQVQKKMQLHSDFGISMNLIWRDHKL